MSASDDIELILASASPRRSELLAVLDVSFEIEPACVDESPLGGEPAREYVTRIARAKAAKVATMYPKAHVLGSDTAVVLADEPLGKPGNAAQARAMLQRLSGRSHQVLSAVVLVEPGGRQRECLSETEVEFAPLPEAWIEAYIDSGDPFDKAGAYGIQNAAGVWVRRIAGSYTGVVGLPLFETGDLLRSANLI
jgi:septum formation protein